MRKNSMGKPVVRVGSGSCPEEVTQKLPETFEKLLKIRVNPSHTMPPNPRVCCTVLDSHHTRYLIKGPFQCEVFVCMSDWTSRRLVQLIKVHVQHEERDEKGILPGFVATLLRSAMKMKNADWGSVQIFTMPKVNEDPHIAMPRRNVRSVSVQSAVGRIDFHVIAQE
jgi:hypothetical protein